MHFQFHFDKALQATGVLLTLVGGRMEYLRLLKLLYISDREMMAESMSPITGDRAVAMDHGPVLSRVYDLIKGIHAQSSEWSHYVATVRYEVEQQRPIPRGKLSVGEIAKLQEVTERYHGTDEWAICEQTHQFGEWKKHFVKGTSTPIPWEEALDAQGKLDKLAAITERERLRREFDLAFGS